MTETQRFPNDEAKFSIAGIDLGLELRHGTLQLTVISAGTRVEFYIAKSNDYGLMREELAAQVESLQTQVSNLTKSFTRKEKP